MDESLMTQLDHCRQLYADAQPTDPKTAERYGWIICRALMTSCKELGSLRCRQLLADYLHLSVKRPSHLHSAILVAATRVATFFPDFHFISFLRLWDLSRFGADDVRPQISEEGRRYPSTVESAARAYMYAVLLRPEEALPMEQLEPLRPTLRELGYRPIQQMVVTKISERPVRDKKMRFALLVGADGMETSCEIHQLRAHPLTPPTGRPHFVSVGQMYDVLFRTSSKSSLPLLADAILSTKSLSEVFPPLVGYVEHVDTSNGYIHVYDATSRHFASHGQHIAVQEGQFVLFHPVVPAVSKFKSALIASVCSQNEGLRSFGMRDITITHVEQEKEYCSWELADPSRPLVELGTQTPSYTYGYLHKSFLDAHHLPWPQEGSRHRAVVFLKRGKDGKKYPHIVYFQ